MPIYEFECEGCATRFDELVASGTDRQPCPSCGREDARRRLSPVSPPARSARTARLRDGEKRRGEREAARRDRLAETRKKRAAGEVPKPRPPKKPA